MKIPKLFLLLVLGIIFLGSGCNKRDILTSDIEGLWISTDETSSQFGPGTDNVSMLIKREPNNIFTVRAFFLQNNEYKLEWKFNNVQYDSLEKKISIVDLDSDTLVIIPDIETSMLKGEVHTKNNISILNFARAEKDFLSYFYPRLPDKNDKIVYTYNKPKQIENNLQTDSIFKFVNDTIAVYTLMNQLFAQKFGRVESILIIKDQKLVLEEYFYNYNRTKLHRINSCTKSVVSLLLGIALNRKNMSNVEQSIFNYFQKYDSLKTAEKEKLALKHVLTMTAGLKEAEESEYSEPDSLIQYLLKIPMETKPGEEFKYSGDCTNLIGGIIYTLENKQADEFAGEVLFSKLGISEFYWQKENGLVNCPSGLYLYPRDMAKIGLLVLNNGYWKGEQIVPEKWVITSTRPHVAESVFFDYGYQWWYRSKLNKSWWENPVHGGKTEHDMFLALGAGGQYIMGIRDLNLVIAITSSDYNDDGMDLQKVVMVIEEIVPIFANE